MHSRAEGATNAANVKHDTYEADDNRKDQVARDAHNLELWFDVMTQEVALVDPKVFEGIDLMRARRALSRAAR